MKIMFKSMDIVNRWYYIVDFQGKKIAKIVVPEMGRRATIFVHMWTKECQVRAFLVNSYVKFTQEFDFKNNCVKFNVLRMDIEGLIRENRVF